MAAEKPKVSPERMAAHLGLNLEDFVEKPKA
jgi:hypothetical protein